MSEKAPSDISFGTEPLHSLRELAGQQVRETLQRDEIPEQAWLEWLFDYYDSEIRMDAIGVWQRTTEAIFQKLSDDKIAEKLPTVWLRGYFPPDDDGPWEYSLAQLSLSTSDMGDPNHIAGRPALDKLEYMHREGYVVDELDYRTRVKTALLQAKPDIQIHQYDESDAPISPNLLTPTIHVRSEGYYGRSKPIRYFTSYPSESEIRQLDTTDINQVFSHCCNLVAYNQIYDALAHSIAQSGSVTPEPQTYLLERWTDAEQTTIGLFEA